MKKIFVFTLAAILLGGYNCAQCTEFETIENNFNIKFTHSIPVSYSQKIKDSFLDGDHRTVLTDFVKTCEPYNENIRINFFGFDFSLNAKSNGWKEDKCFYEFSAKVNSVSSYVKQMLNITADDSQITAINPKMECNFNKKQLEVFANELIANSSKSKRTSEAVYKPAQNDLKISKRNTEFLSLMTNPEVCRLVNEEDVMKALQIFSSSPLSD
ncbi:hypothetical protein IJ596_05560 [bacterium]|nr:hypothetical protein [bacterium]